jgi:hypothetical protein
MATDGLSIVIIDLPGRGKLPANVFAQRQFHWMP